MKMKAKNLCKNCMYCKILYDAICRFWKTKFHICTAQDKITKLDNSCELWQKKANNYDFSTERFDYVEECVNYLLDIYSNT